MVIGYLIFIALERVVELWLSKRNAARAFARGAIEVGRAHYRVMAVFHTLFLVSCAIEMRRDHFSIIALAGALLAQALRWWAISSLGDRWNVRVIVLPGAAPVVAGPYRWLRHPNYVAVMMEMICVPLIGGAWITALVFSLGNAALLVVRIRAEEAALGDRYNDAFSATPRFIPGGGP